MLSNRLVEGIDDFSEGFGIEVRGFEVGDGRRRRGGVRIVRKGRR